MNQKFWYTAVLAEVIFTIDGKNSDTQKVQFFTKSDIEHFPIKRLQQLQNSSVMMLQNAGKKLGTIQGVWLLQLVPLGYMTDEEFGGEVTSVNGEPMPEELVKEPEAAVPAAANDESAPE